MEIACNETINNRSLTFEKASRFLINGTKRESFQELKIISNINRITLKAVKTIERITLDTNYSSDYFIKKISSPEVVVKSHFNTFPRKENSLVSSPVGKKKRGRPKKVCVLEMKSCPNENIFIISPEKVSVELNKSKDINPTKTSEKMPINTNYISNEVNKSKGNQGKKTIEKNKEVDSEAKKSKKKAKKSLFNEFSFKDYFSVKTRAQSRNK